MSYKKLDLNIQDEEPFLIDDNINLKSFLKEMEDLNNENYEKSLNLLTEAEYNNEVNRYNTNNAEYTTDSNNLNLYVNADDLSTLYTDIQTDKSNIGNTLSISDFSDMVNYLNYDNQRIIELGNSNISLSIQPKNIGSFKKDGITYIKYRGGYQYIVKASLTGFPMFHIRTDMLDDLDNVFISKFSNLKIETPGKTITCGFNGSFNSAVRYYSGAVRQTSTGQSYSQYMNDCLSPTILYAPRNKNTSILSEYGFYIKLFNYSSDTWDFTDNIHYNYINSDQLGLRCNFMWGTKRPQITQPYYPSYVTGLADIEYNAYNMCEGEQNDEKNPAYTITVTPSDITYTISIFFEYTQEEE